MFQLLKICNFQKHEHTQIEFDQYLTCIIGKTDTGKSSIVRAIRWACLNKPSGESFKKQGEDSVSVSLVVDSKKIKRKKSKGENTYSFNKKTYSSLGQSNVPEDISSLLNIGEENFASQHDPCFWFHLSPGELSKELNRIIDLSKLDKTLANLAGNIRKTKSIISVSEDRLNKARERKNSLAWTIQADTKLKELEALEEEINNKEKSTNYLESLITQIRKTESELDTIRIKCILGQKVIDAGDCYFSALEKTDRFENICNEIKRTKKDIESTKEKRGKKEAELKNIKVCPLCERRIND